MSTTTITTPNNINTNNVDTQTDTDTEFVTQLTLSEQVMNNHKAINELVKEQYKLLKTLEAEMKKNSKKVKGEKKQMKQNPQKVNDEMQKFITKNFKDDSNKESMYTRHQMQRFVSTYIKSQNIQNPENKKEWSGKDKTLKKLFGLTENWYAFIQVNGLISKVIVK